MQYKGVGAAHVPQASGLACTILYLNVKLPKLEPPAHGVSRKSAPKLVEVCQSNEKCEGALETLSILRGFWSTLWLLESTVRPAYWFPCCDLDS